MSEMDESKQFSLIMQIIEILNLNCETAEEARELLEQVNELIGFDRLISPDFTKLPLVYIAKRLKVTQHGAV